MGDPQVKRCTASVPTAWSNASRLFACEERWDAWTRRDAYGSRVLRLGAERSPVRIRSSTLHLKPNREAGERRLPTICPRFAAPLKGGGWDRLRGRRPASQEEGNGRATQHPETAANGKPLETAKTAD